MAKDRKQYGRWTRVPENGHIAVTLADKRVLKFRLADIHKNCVDTTLGYGLKQKLVDGVADADNLAEYVEGIMATWERLKQGQWEAERVFVFQREPIIEALLRVTKGKYTREKIAELSDEKLKEFSKEPSVNVALKEIALEKARAAEKAAAPIEIKF